MSRPYSAQHPAFVAREQVLQEAGIISSVHSRQNVLASTPGEGS